MRVFNKKAILFATLLVGLPNSLWAMEYYPTNMPPDFYGHGQTDSFSSAIYGGRELTPQEKRDINSMIPASLDNRFYIRVGMHGATERLSNIKNITAVDPLTKEKTLTKTGVKITSNRLEAAAGYHWKTYRFDIEWLPLQSMEYSGSIQGTSNYALTGSVKGDAVLGNFYWEFKELFLFKLYASGTFGFTNNDTILKMDAEEHAMRKLGMSFGGGIGARAHIFGSFYVDVTARYLHLGNVKMEAIGSAGNASATLKATRKWIGASARLMWLL